jgi:large subunit ribosomal protein L5
MAETKKTHSDRKAMRAFIEKVVIDAGVGRLGQQPNFEEKILPQVLRDIAAVTGQQPQLRRAKESIAFFERLITIVLPRVRDFSGLEHSAIDQGGTLNVGVRDHLVFPEISPEQSPVVFSIGVSVVPKIRNRVKSVEKFAAFGVPMKKEAEVKKKKRI